MHFILFVAGVIIIPIIWVSIVRLILEQRISPDEVHFAPTADGYEIALYRYRPDRINLKREPVILCHGLSANHLTWDPGSLPSFARHLVKEGFDVFTIDLRGRGLSSKPGSRRGRPLEWGWTFDDYVKYDLPAVINYVRRLTGFKEVNWVGHSMGGMVIYAYLQHHPDGGGLKSATAIASPGNFEHAKQYKPSLKYAPLILRWKTVYTKTLARFLAPFAYLVPAKRFGMSRRVMPWMAVNGLTNISSGELQQFYYWAKNGTFSNKDGSMVYSDGFDKISRPLLTLVGKGDYIASPKNILHVAESCQKPEHKHVYFSKKYGSMANYDHISILMSEPAVKEVYPIITDWLKKHSSA